MPELKCKDCGKIIGHTWGGYVEEIGTVLCIDCHNKRKTEQKQNNRKK